MGSKIQNRIFKKIKKLSKLVAHYHKLPYSNYSLEDAASNKYKNLYRVMEVEVDGKKSKITKPANKSYRLEMSQKGLKNHLVWMYLEGNISETALDILIKQNLSVNEVKNG